MMHFLYAMDGGREKEKDRRACTQAHTQNQNMDKDCETKTRSCYLLIEHSEVLLDHSQMNVRNEACRQSPTASTESGLDGVDDSGGKKNKKQKTIVSFFSSLQAFDPRRVWVITGPGIITGS